MSTGGTISGTPTVNGTFKPGSLNAVLPVPENAMAVTVIGELPSLETVSGRLLVVPILTVPKFRSPDNWITRVAASPVPFTAIFAAPRAAFDTRLTVPVFTPTTVGLKTIVTLVTAFGARLWTTP